MMINKERKPAGYWKNISDENLIHYVRSDWYGANLGQLNESNTCVSIECRTRKIKAADSRVITIQDFLIEEGTLLDLHSDRRDWQNISDLDLIHYVRSNHYGDTITEFQKSRDTRADEQCKKRKINTEDGTEISIRDFLIKEGTLIDKYISRRDWKNMPDWDLIHYLRSQHYEDTLAEVNNDSDRINKECLKRKIKTEDGLEWSIRDFLVEEGTLIDKHSGRILKNWDDFEKKLQIVISELNHFPTRNELSAMNLFPLYEAISKYHGGMEAVKEKMGYQTSDQVTKEQLRETLEAYVNDEE